MKHIKIFLMIATALMLSCKHISEYVSDIELDDDSDLSPQESVKKQFRKFSTAVCKQQTSIYEKYISMNSLLKNKKSRLMAAGKSEEEANEIFRMQYTKLFIELDKGEASKFCKMVVEPIVYQRFDRNSIEINEMIAQFANRNKRTYSLTSNADGLYAISDGILDF